MNNKLFHTLIIVLLISGCEKKLFDDSVKTQTTGEIIVEEKQISSEDIKIEYLGQNTPNLYNVRVSWENTQGYVVLKKNNQIVFDSSKIGFVKDYVIKNQPGGGSFQMTAETFTQAKEPVDVRDINIEIPKDLAFEGRAFLNENAEYVFNRVFFLNSEVYTSQFNLNIKAQELISSGTSVISNFTNGSQAGYETKGLSAGNINIHAVTASGNIAIIRNAQSGGNGYAGSIAYTTCEMHQAGYKNEEREPPVCTDIKHPACSGTSGADAGFNGDLNVYIEKSEKLNFLQKESIASGGSAGPHGRQNIKGYPFTPYQKACESGPTNGQPGSIGKKCIILTDSNVYDCAQ